MNAKAGNDPDRGITFLPMTSAETRKLGWDTPDVILVTGDAYVDQPTFGAALLGRWLSHHGYRVCIVAQPQWQTLDDIQRLGIPRLFVGVTAGSLDSMLAHYTAFRKKRRDDAYTPGGRTGARPNRATIVYSGLARRAFPGVPVIIGGIEASMRRATHYDFWSDKLRRSILLDSKADLLVYGMAERALLEICRRLENLPNDGADTAPAAKREALRGIPGTVGVLTPRNLAETPLPGTNIRLPSHEEILSDRSLLMKAALMLERCALENAAPAVQMSGREAVIFNEPAKPLSTAEMDELYGLPFTGRPHPSYRQPVPALETVRHSLTTHRGCAGGCSFCSIALHQGRRIASRSAKSIIAEAKRLTGRPEWRGSISDVGGPTANMWNAVCRRNGVSCSRSSCLTPDVCRYFDDAQDRTADLLDAVAAVDGIEHVRVASGVRHDLALRNSRYMRKLVERYVGGQIKIAPEHCCADILALMRKPPFPVFERFLSLFDDISRKAGRKQYVLPYLISAFPGCTDAHMRKLRRWLDRSRWTPQQVQCFIPLPGTIAAAMYFAGIAPDGRKIPVARTDAERLRQHAILAGTRRGGSSRRNNGGMKRG